MPSTPADQLAALKAQAALLEVQNRLEAARQEAARLKGIAIAAAEKNAAVVPPGNRITKLVNVVAPTWHQDVLQRPATSASGRINDTLAATDKMHAAYPFSYQVTAAGGLFKATFPIELNRAFYIANMVSVRFQTSNQAVFSSREGFITVRDNANGNAFIDSIPAPCLALQAPSAGARTIWPLPYAIGAGGSFEVSIDVPATAGLNTNDSQLVMEGWWDFSHMERSHG